MRPLAGYPVLTTPLRWGNVHLTGFQLLHEVPDVDHVQSVNIVPFVGDHCVVITVGDGDASLPGGTMERGETFLETARREIREEVGAEILSLALVGQWDCHSDDAEPWRAHLPHPDFIRLVLCGEIAIVGPPENPEDAEQISRVDVVPLDVADSFLALSGRRELAELYRLAHGIWTALPEANRSIDGFDAYRRAG